MDAEVSTENRVDRAFAQHRAEGQKTLIPFVCAGFPTLETLPAVIPAIEAAGADIIEVGLPYSDPIADGPVIAAAMHSALSLGMRTSIAFEQVAFIRSDVEAAIVLMCSVSLVRGYGPSFPADAASAGVDGVIVPDAPVEEFEGMLGRFRDAGLVTPMLIAPTTPAERAERIVKSSSGFVYLLARSGITGEQSEAPDITGRVSRLREMTAQPIACGFGISTREHVAHVVESADAAIVGSAIVRRMKEAEDPVSEAAAMVASLSAGLGGMGTT